MQLHVLIHAPEGDALSPQGSTTISLAPRRRRLDISKQKVHSTTTCVLKLEEKSVRNSELNEKETYKYRNSYEGYIELQETWAAVPRQQVPACMEP